MNCKIQDMKPIFVQLVNHEPHYFVILLRDHTDAISLPETSNEIILAPGKLKAGVLDSKHRRHVSANHPANMNAHRFGFHVGLLSSEIPRLKDNIVLCLNPSNPLDLKWTGD